MERNEFELQEVPEEPIENPFLGFRTESPVYGLENSDSGSVVDEPPAKQRKTEEYEDKAVDKFADEGDDCCSICFERYTQSGDHKISSLKCGHLFGNNCLLQWLKMPDCRVCPTCKAPAQRRDIRLIYAKRLVAADNTELDAMTVKYDEERSRCLKLELELSKSILIRSSLSQRIEELEEMNAILQKKLGKTDQTEETTCPPVAWRLALEKNVEICVGNTCRVIRHDVDRRLLYVTKQSQNSLFPGFGVKQLHYETFAHGACLQLHPKDIRDMAYSKRQDYLLTASLDKTAKMVSMAHSRVALTFSCEMPLWSCSWDYSNADRFFVGGAGGVVLQYDVRQTRTCLSRLAQPQDISQVISLVSTPHGLLACQLKSCRLMRQAGPSFRSYPVSIDGPFMSLTYEPSTDLFLLSSRPSQSCTRTRHRLCRIDFDGDACVAVVEATLEGSPVQAHMSTACQLYLGADTLVAAYNERENAVVVHSTGQRRQLQSLPSQDHVIDMTPIVDEYQKILATLSGNRVRIYKAVH